MSASNLSTKAEHAVAAGASIGQGQVGDWGHPLHPATVHFPIGLLALSFTLDSLQLAPSLMSKLSSYSLLPPSSLIRPLAHYAGAAGVLASIPTIATGVAELYQMWRNQVKDTRTVGTIAKDVKNSAQSDAIAGQKLRTTLTHASLNDVVIGIAAYNWWVRRTAPGLVLPKTNAALSTVAIPIFLYSAYLGGSLVYEYGVGVQRQGEAKKIKESS